MSLIDLYLCIYGRRKDWKLNNLWFLDYIKPLRNVDEEEFTAQTAYFYTDLNLDGHVLYALKMVVGN